MIQVHRGAVGLCQKIVTLKLNNCASFCVGATVIQIMSMNSLPCLLTCYFSTRSEVSLGYNCSRSLKFNICGPDHKICTYIESGLFPLFLRHNM